jgi:hypothetical protein
VFWLRSYLKDTVGTPTEQHNTTSSLNEHTRALLNQ